MAGETIEEVSIDLTTAEESKGPNPTNFQRRHGHAVAAGGDLAAGVRYILVGKLQKQLPKRQLSGGAWVYYALSCMKMCCASFASAACR